MTGRALMRPFFYYLRLLWNEDVLFFGGIF